MIFLTNFFNWITNFKGELAALSAAFLWAIASLVYSRLGRQIPPLELNLFKGIIAIAFLVLTLLLQGQLLPEINPTALTLLLLSGVLGIGLGDTAYFAAINCLGARRTLILETLAPPLTAVLALVFLQEQLTAAAWCGILLTILGVVWVVTERVPNSTAESKHLTMRGISWGLLAAVAQATGAVLSRTALIQSSISPLWSTLVRLGAGVLVLLLWKLLGRRQANDWLKPLQSWRIVGVIAITAFFSTYLGIWLQQISLKFAPAGIAQTLSSTSPLFVLPLAIWMGDVVSFRAILGVLVALGGVAVLFSLR
ncbi:DMT family transporter [Trichocoleus sp. DQ-A3]|uniref:DMT family transporter n=1 Tax=Cyanophyceae TaxID=3028117 RepID=UPI0016860022|nr:MULTISPECIES: DMT family transporter [unclassified Coleofasciculus]MBD1901752.1 DMT family transporter [Coleofasciculus sp. FACHB-125]MBD2084638.1 DMT family transporter [Coleofasciculus sp. FACHB-542]